MKPHDASLDLKCPPATTCYQYPHSPSSFQFWQHAGQQVPKFFFYRFSISCFFDFFVATDRPLMAPCHMASRFLLLVCAIAQSAAYGAHLAPATGQVADATTSNLKQGTQPGMDDKRSLVQGDDDGIGATHEERRLGDSIDKPSMLERWSNMLSDATRPIRKSVGHASFNQGVRNLVFGLKHLKISFNTLLFLDLDPIFLEYALGLHAKSKETGLSHIDIKIRKEYFETYKTYRKEGRMKWAGSKESMPSLWRHEPPSSPKDPPLLKSPASQ